MREGRQAGQARLAVGAHDKRFVEPPLPMFNAGVKEPAPARAKPKISFDALLTFLAGSIAWIRRSVRSGAPRPFHDATLSERTRQREQLTEILLVISSAGTMVLTYYTNGCPV